MESIPSGVSANTTDSHHSKEITPGCVNAIMASKHDSGVIVGGVKPILTPDRETVRQHGRRIKETEEPMFTLTGQDRHGIVIEGGQTPINTNVDGTARCICAGLYKQNWSHFDPTREKQTYTGVVVNETDTNSVK